MPTWCGVQEQRVLIGLTSLHTENSRARIAFLAIARRCSGVSFSCRAFAPKRPKATALGFFSFLKLSMVVLGIAPACCVH